MPALFRGESAWETRCKACGRLSEGSHRATGFYELDVQVQGAPTLELALVRPPRGLPGCRAAARRLPVRQQARWAPASLRSMLQ